MDRPYSAWADWLDKFHTSSEFIQALWLVMVPLTVLGVTALVMHPLRGVLVDARERRRRGRLLYGLYEDAQGRVRAYRDGDLQVLGAPAPPLPLPPSSPTGSGDPSPDPGRRRGWPGQARP